MKSSRVTGTNEELRRMISEFEGKLKEREQSLQEVTKIYSFLSVATYFHTVIYEVISAIWYDKF